MLMHLLSCEMNQLHPANPRLVRDAAGQGEQQVVANPCCQQCAAIVAKRGELAQHAGVQSTRDLCQVVLTLSRVPACKERKGHLLSNFWIMRRRSLKF